MGLYAIDIMQQQLYKKYFMGQIYISHWTMTLITLYLTQLFF